MLGIDAANYGVVEPLEGSRRHNMTLLMYKTRRTGAGTQLACIARYARPTRITPAQGVMAPHALTTAGPWQVLDST